MQLAIIGVPGTKRTQQVVEAARDRGFSRIEVRSWREACDGRFTPEEGTLVRIESPSDCLDTLKLILRYGVEPLMSVGGVPMSGKQIDNLAPNRGEMIHPRQWYFGLCAVMRRWESRWRQIPLQWMSTPASIATAFDKVECLERWESVRLPVPRRYNSVSSYEHLRSLVVRPHARLFVKLRYGYSAMGALALEWRGALVRAISTVEVERSGEHRRLFVTKRPKSLLRESEISWLFDILAREEIVVEDWLPKDRWQGKSYDLRLVMIGGRLRHAVGRSSATPFTNLNLDGMRISRSELVDRLGATWDTLSSLAERAAACLPDAGMLGLDVLPRPRLSGFVLLEANAFGDYLPGLLHAGESTYGTQFRRWSPTGAAT